MQAEINQEQRSKSRKKERIFSALPLNLVSFCYTTNFQVRYKDVFGCQDDVNVMQVLV
ncbi:hypothetical protein V6Z11_D03G077500 [Gossypium hirsutum]